MTDRIHISGLTAHKITGTVLIVKCKILLQKLAVHLIAHTIQHSLRAFLKKNLGKETAKTFNNDRSQQKCDQIWQHPGLPVINNIIHDHSRNNRIDKGCHSQDRHQHKPPEHFPLILPQKTVKPLHRSHSRLPPFYFLIILSFSHRFTFCYEAKISVAWSFQACYNES